MPHHHRTARNQIPAAIKADNVGLLERCFRQGMPLTARLDRQRTYLHMAAHKGSPKCIAFLARFAVVQEAQCTRDLVQTLLNYGAEVNHTSSHLDLFEVCCKMGNSSVAALVALHGGDVSCLPESSDHGRILRVKAEFLEKVRTELHQLCDVRFGMCPLTVTPTKPGSFAQAGAAMPLACIESLHPDVQKAIASVHSDHRGNERAVHDLRRCVGLFGCSETWVGTATHPGWFAVGTGTVRVLHPTQRGFHLEGTNKHVTAALKLELSSTLSSEGIDILWAAVWTWLALHPPTNLHPQGVSIEDVVPNDLPMVWFPTADDSALFAPLTAAIAGGSRRAAALGLTKLEASTLWAAPAKQNQLSCVMLPPLPVLSKLLLLAAGDDPSPSVFASTSELSDSDAAFEDHKARVCGGTVIESMGRQDPAHVTVAVRLLACMAMEQAGQPIPPAELDVTASRPHEALGRLTVARHPPPCASGGVGNATLFSEFALAPIGTPQSDDGSDISSETSLHSASVSDPGTVCGVSADHTPTVNPPPRVLELLETAREELHMHGRWYSQYQASVLATVSPSVSGTQAAVKESDVAVLQAWRFIRFLLTLDEDPVVNAVSWTRPPPDTELPNSLSTKEADDAVDTVLNFVRSAHAAGFRLSTVASLVPAWEEHTARFAGTTAGEATAHIAAFFKQQSALLAEGSAESTEVPAWLGWDGTSPVLVPPIDVMFPAMELRWSLPGPLVAASNNEVASPPLLDFTTAGCIVKLPEVWPFDVLDECDADEAAAAYFVHCDITAAARCIESIAATAPPVIRSKWLELAAALRGRSSSLSDAVQAV